MRVALLAIVAFSALTACAAPTVDTGADEQALRDILVAWDAAFNQRDIESLVGLYAEDAVLMAPNQPSAVGHQELRASFQAEWQATTAALQNQVDEIHVSGDLATVRGSGQGMITPSDGSGSLRGSLDVGYSVPSSGRWILEDGVGHMEQ